MASERRFFDRDSTSSSARFLSSFTWPANSAENSSSSSAQSCFLASSVPRPATFSSASRCLTVDSFSSSFISLISSSCFSRRFACDSTSVTFLSRFFSFSSMRAWSFSNSLLSDCASIFACEIISFACAFASASCVLMELRISTSFILIAWSSRSFSLICAWTEALIFFPELNQNHPARSPRSSPALSARKTIVKFIERRGKR